MTAHIGSSPSQTNWSAALSLRKAKHLLLGTAQQCCGNFHKPQKTATAAVYFSTFFTFSLLIYLWLSPSSPLCLSLHHHGAISSLFLVCSSLISTTPLLPISSSPFFLSLCLWAAVCYIFLDVRYESISSLSFFSRHFHQLPSASPWPEVSVCAER